nr:hypothetical protein [Candidatus Microthrix sp.]
MLRTFCSVVVIDTPAYFNDVVLSLVEISDEILLLAGMDIPNIKNVKTGLQTLRLLGTPMERVHLTSACRRPSTRGCRWCYTLHVRALQRPSTRWPIWLRRNRRLGAAERPDQNAITMGSEPGYRRRDPRCAWRSSARRTSSSISSV